MKKEIIWKKENTRIKENKMLLYHTGFQEIAHPDVHFGRKNADFGQGFYTADDETFAVRWAREKRGEAPLRVSTHTASAG